MTTEFTTSNGRGESFVKQVIDYGAQRETTGLGIHFDMADITGNGFPDLVAPGKDGLYLFVNEGVVAKGFRILTEFMLRRKPTAPAERIAVNVTFATQL